MPPWVEEHPDVFSDPNFSITQLDTPTPPHLGAGMDPMSLGEDDQGGVAGGKREVWVSV